MCAHCTVRCRWLTTSTFPAGGQQAKRTPCSAAASGCWPQTFSTPWVFAAAQTFSPWCGVISPVTPNKID